MQILEKYVEYADAELHKYGHKKPGVRQVAQVFLFLRYQQLCAWNLDFS